MITPPPTANAQDVTAMHTPGPWVAHTFMVMGGADQRDRITHVGGNLPPMRVNEAVANARLIAAAPDLLAIAQRILDRGYVSSSIEEERDDHNALAAAIAKVTAA